VPNIALIIDSGAITCSHGLIDTQSTNVLAIRTMEHRILKAQLLETSINYKISRENS